MIIVVSQVPSAALQKKRLAAQYLLEDSKEGNVEKALAVAGKEVCVLEGHEKVHHGGSWPVLNQYFRLMTEVVFEKDLLEGMTILEVMPHGGWNLYRIVPYHDSIDKLDRGHLPSPTDETGENYSD